jgi:hypothetical protein
MTAFHLPQSTASVNSVGHTNDLASLSAMAVAPAPQKPSVLAIARLLEPFAMLWIHLMARRNQGRNFAFGMLRR